MYYGSFYKDFNGSSQTAISFYWSSSFHISSTLDLWISNPVEHTVIQVLSSSYSKPKGTLIRVAGNKGTANYRDGDLSTSLLNTPKSCAYYNDKVYVADTNNHCIRVIDLSVKSIKQFAGQCKMPGFKDGPSQFNMLHKPDLVGAANGTLVVNDKGNNYVRIVNITSGYMNTLWGGACREVNGNSSKWVKPEYDVKDSLFYVDNGSIHTMVCDIGMVKSYGIPNEHIFNINDYPQTCTQNIVKCENRTSPFVMKGN